MVIELCASSVSSNELAFLRNTRRSPSCGMYSSIGSSSEKLPSSSSSKAAQEVTNLVFEHTRRCGQSAARCSPPCPPSRHIASRPKISTNEHRPRNSGEDVSVDVSAQSRMRCREVAVAGAYGEVAEQATWRGRAHGNAPGQGPATRRCKCGGPDDGPVCRASGSQAAVVWCACSYPCPVA